MKKFIHLVITDDPSVLHSQTNKNFIVSDEVKVIDSNWVIVSYISGKVHPDFIERVQSRFRPYPFQLITKGYKHYNGKYYQSSCNHTYSVIGRPGELMQDLKLPKEHINEFLYCEETDFPDCIGDEMEVEEWMRHE